MTGRERTPRANRMGGTAGVRLERVMSGGQTGVDRAALDVALELGIECGGWCPRGRKAEDGVIPERYPLQETPGRKYAERTEQNVRDSDATLIVTVGTPMGGTALTKACAERLCKPWLVVDLAATTDEDIVRVAGWLRENAVRALNVAGPRESQQPGIGEQSRRFLRRLFAPAGVANN